MFDHDNDDDDDDADADDDVIMIWQEKRTGCVSCFPWTRSRTAVLPRGV